MQDGGDTLFKDLAEWYRKVEPFKVKQVGPVQNGNTFFTNQLARWNLNNSFLFYSNLQPFLMQNWAKAFGLSESAIAVLLIDST